MGNGETRILSRHGVRVFGKVAHSTQAPCTRFCGDTCYCTSVMGSSTVPFISKAHGVGTFRLSTPVVTNGPFFRCAGRCCTVLGSVRSGDGCRKFCVGSGVVIGALSHCFGGKMNGNVTQLLFSASMLLCMSEFYPRSCPAGRSVRLFRRFIICTFI